MKPTTITFYEAFSDSGEFEFRTDSLAAARSYMAHRGSGARMVLQEYEAIGPSKPVQQLKATKPRRRLMAEKRPRFRPATAGDDL